MKKEEKLLEDLQKQCEDTKARIEINVKTRELVEHIRKYYRILNEIESHDPLDGDDTERIAKWTLNTLDYQEGNITEEEYHQAYISLTK